MKLAGKIFVCLLACAAMIGLATAVGAQEGDAYVGIEPEVLDQQLEPVAAPEADAQVGADAQVAGVAETRGEVSGADRLAFTGGDIAGLALIGLLAVALGSVVLVRRRSASA